MKTATARSTPNIALIKYWGNRHNEWRLPAADSLSMTLNSPAVEVTVSHADTLKVTSWNIDGSQRVLTEKQIARFEKHLNLMKEYLQETVPNSLTMEIRSHIPTAVGLASSAAVFSALAKAISGLVSDEVQLSSEQESILARLGSGSAARSILGGYVALRNSKKDTIDSAIAEQIADEQHWLLHDIVIVPSHEEKKVTSSEGHELAQTSPLFGERINAIPRRQQECIDAILKKDFEKLQYVAEEDALDMHRVMESSTPSLRYLSEETHRIIREVEQLRQEKHLPVLYTMDAGPTVHLICTSEAVDSIKTFSQSQKDCTIFETQVGPGATLIS